MKLLKKFFSIATVFSLVFGTTVTVFANPVDDIRVTLEKAGVPASDTGKVIEYLQKTKIDKSQGDKAISEVDSVTSKLNGGKDLTKVSDSVRKSIEGNITAAISALGLKADFGSKSSTGATILKIKDSSGATLTSGDVNSANNIVTNFNPKVLRELVIAIENFSNDPNKTKFNAIDGAPMKHTATNYGNIMTVGFILIIVATASLMFKRKAVLS